MTNKSKFKVLVILLLLGAFLLGSVIAVNAGTQTATKKACSWYGGNKVCLNLTSQASAFVDIRGISAYTTKSKLLPGWTIQTVTAPYFYPASWTTSHVTSGGSYNFRYNGILKKFVACSVVTYNCGDGTVCGGGGCMP